MFQSSLFNSIVSKYGQYLLAGLFLFIFSLVLVGRSGVLAELLQRGPKLAVAMEDCPDCGDAGTPAQDTGEGPAEVAPSIPEEPAAPVDVPAPEPAPQPEPVYNDPGQGAPAEDAGTPEGDCRQQSCKPGTLTPPAKDVCEPKFEHVRNECVRCGYSSRVVKNSCTGELTSASVDRDTDCDNYAPETCPDQPAPAPVPVVPPPAQVCTPGQADVNSRACTGAPCTYTVKFCNAQGSAFDDIRTETNCSLAPAVCQNACTPTETPRQTRCSNGQRCFRNHWTGTQIDASTGRCSEGDGGEYCQSDASCGGSTPPAPAAPAAPAASTAICMVCDNNGQTWRQAGSGNITSSACAAIANSQWNNTTRPAWCQPAVVNNIPQGTTASCNGQSGVITLGNGSFLNCNINNNNNDNRSSATATGGNVSNVGNNNGAANVGNNNGATNVGNNNGNSNGIGNGGPGNGGVGGDAGNINLGGTTTTHPVVVITTSQTQDFSCPANTEKKVSGNTVMCLPLCRAGETRTVNGSSVICTTALATSTAQVVKVVTTAVLPQKVSEVQVAADQLPKTGLPLAAWLLVGVAPLGAKWRRFGRSGKDAITPNLLWEERQFKKV